MTFTKGDRIKRERIGLYLDVIIGLFSSVISLSGMIYVALSKGIMKMGWFITSFTCWIVYLLVSIFMISYGLYSYLKEKNFDETKQKKDLRAPIA